MLNYVAITSLQKQLLGLFNKKTFWKNFENFTGKHLRWISLYVILHKMSSIASVLLWNLQNLAEHHFYRTLRSACFYILFLFPSSFQPKILEYE